ncbi:MAG: CHAT domain-containing protein [Acidobacteria bacterium]|nr:CHAT domain-containing protein [Acidobacteriota bacterium]MBV9476822.1 CHAT domain-containing protein [Acidobacteriota bacterium]
MLEKSRSTVARVATVFVLCVAASCGRETNVSSNAPRRPVAARRTLARLTDAPEWSPCTVSLRPGHIVQEAACASHIANAPVSVGGKDCDDMIGNHEETLRTLVAAPRCTDAAIRRLRTLAEQQPQAGRLWSDLAAAYALRAERDDRPSDLLRSLDAAEAAIARDPQLTEARFNRALALEQVGLPKEAEEQWDQLRRGSRSGWTREADEHWSALRRDASRAAASQWPRNQERIEAVVAAGDRKALASLIDPFRGAAHRYVEEEVLPAWAAAAASGDAGTAQRQLAIADAIAQTLTIGTGDRYLLRIVERIHEVERAKDEVMLGRLRRGHAAYGDARRTERAIGAERAERTFARAQQLLTDAKSELACSATMARAIALSFRNQFAEAMALLEPVEAHAHANDYWYVLGRARSNQAYLYTYQSRFIEALDRYDAAIEAFARMGDAENVANAHTRKIGILRTLGDPEQAWTESFLASRDQARFVEAPSRHEFLGETAEAATALDCPKIALLYQTAAVQLFQDRLAETPSTDSDRIVALHRNLGIALRGMAAVHIRLNDYRQADRDLSEAFRFISEGTAKDDQGVRQALLARIKGVEGDAALGEERFGQAVTAFTDAFRLASETPFRTFRAELLMGRAEAFRHENRRADSERDLRAAIAELRAEEDGLLDRRRRGSSEEFWSAYFSRSQETYQRLIRLLADDNRKQEAFTFAEQARAYEPLHLVLQLDTLTTQAFRRWTHDGRSLALEEIQSSLPADTFLLEYSVLDDRTYVWIVSRRTFEMLTLPVHKKAIESWNDKLRADAREQNIDGFETTLCDVHHALVSGPLEVLASIPHTADARLVFSPDGPMHGLPFAALRSDGDSPYLIENHRLSIAASGTLYIYSILRDRELAVDGRRSAILIGDPAFVPSNATRGLDRLPRGRSEVRRIAPLYAPAVQVLVDKDATAPRFFDLAPDAAIVHVAAHAVARPEMPFRSLMLLAPSHDHLSTIDAQELLTRFRTGHTRLVVLSACSSTGGVPIGPEGLAPLVRPFITAGVPAVVGSLWDVGDAPSEELLVAFHQYYRDGLDADDALRLAQIQIRKHDDAGFHWVFAWAPYQIVGQASSPFRPNHTGEN